MHRVIPTGFGWIGTASAPVRAAVRRVRSGRGRGHVRFPAHRCAAHTIDARPAYGRWANEATPDPRPAPIDTACWEDKYEKPPTSPNVPPHRVRCPDGQPTPVPRVAYAGVMVVPPVGQWGGAALLGAPRPTIQPLRALPRPDLPSDVERRPGRAAPRDDLDRGDTTSRSWTMSTTVVGGSTRPTPHSRTTGAAPPSRPTASRCSAISSAAEAPLSASSRPPIAVRGKHQPASRSRGATARAVTMSAGAIDPAPPAEARAARSLGGSPTHSSALARSTVTAPVRPRVVTASARKAIRRASGSTSVTERSGRATASTIPGKPAPDPTSTTEAPMGSIPPRLRS